MSNREVVGQLKGASDPISIEWEIADFLSLPAEVDVHHESSRFFFYNTLWYLRLYPNGAKRDSSEGHIGVYLTKGKLDPPVTVTYSLFLKMADGGKDVVNKSKKTFDGKNRGWGGSCAIRRSELIELKSDYMPSGVLTVICSLECDETERVRGTTKDVALQTTVCSTPNSKALCDFENLLLNKEVCDVTLQVKEQKFEAHQTILRARSPVFASMLNHDMQEKNTGLIIIKDCEPEHFPDFLRFLYCGSGDCITSENMFSLYRAGDKYDVQDLKSECLTFIKSHLDVDNFCEVITLALQHGETDLIKQATDFFGENILKIIVTVKWQVFVTENPIQSNELTIKALSAHKCHNN